jgi:hypothetical protein
MLSQRKIGPVALYAYLALWCLTWLIAPRVLSREMLADARVEHHRFTVEFKAKGGSGVNEMAGPAGPSATVKMIFCPAPFVFKANVSRYIGPLNAAGWEGWYVWPVWKVYMIRRDEQHSWVS